MIAQPLPDALPKRGPGRPPKAREDAMAPPVEALALVSLVSPQPEPIQAAHASGPVAVAGRVHRCPDDDFPLLGLPALKWVTDAEASRIVESAQALAAMEDRIDRLRCSGGRRAALTDELAALEDEHAVLRGHARQAILAAVRSAAGRAAPLAWAAACQLAREMAELEALGRMEDDLLGRQLFDPLGTWERANAVLAPPLHLRPPGWACGVDMYGRETYWTPSSPGNREQVRRIQKEVRAELEPLLSGAAWPF